MWKSILDGYAVRWKSCRTETGKGEITYEWLLKAPFASSRRWGRLGESATSGWPPAVCLMISGNCVELLQAFDVLPIYPEVNALQLAIRHQSLEPILAAEEIGYASDNCAYVIRQLREVVGLLEGITKTKFDYDKFKQAVGYSAQVEGIWSEIKYLAKSSPSPFDAYFDAITLMGPLYVYRGTKEGVEFFRAALRELKEKVAHRQGVYDEERFRLVVEGPPPYPHFRTFRDMFAKWKACAVASTYSTVGGLWEFGFRHDPEKPFETMARHMLEHNVTNRNYLQRYGQIKRYVDEWKADGIIIHFVKSCRLFSAGQGDMRDYFTKVLKVPTLYIESDLEDPRYFSEAQIKNRMDAFFEALEHQKRL